MKSLSIHLYGLLFYVIFDVQGSFIDTDPFVVLTPPRNSDIDFGFSLALLNGTGDLKLLVGAPNAKHRSNPYETVGDLYSCKLNTFNNCEQLNVDTRTEKYNQYTDSQTMEKQRLGQSISTQGDTVVTCAHIWNYKVEMPGSDQFNFPVGRCFVSKQSLTFTDFVPTLDDKNKNISHTKTIGNCMTGISTTFTMDGNIAYGSPGCSDAVGSIYETNFNGEVTTVYEDGITLEQLYNTTGLDNSYNIFYKYFGYSTASGVFATKACVVSSMVETYITDVIAYGPTPPVVVILQKTGNNYEVWETIHTPQYNTEAYEKIWLFSFFGSSLAVIDMDNDGLDDLIVGAPGYGKELSDEGAVVVYKQIKYKVGNEDSYTMKYQNIINGPTKFAKFGTSIANLGDIDADGYDDLAVGAPNYKLDSDTSVSGAVYIYRGGPDGFQSHVQMIKGYSESFGYAIGSNFQLERGNRRDIVIGAPKSDRVYMLKSFQVIFVEFEIKLESSFTLDDICPNSNGVSVQCKNMSMCVKYTVEGEQADFFKTEDVVLNLEVNIDTSSQKKFMFADTTKIKTIEFKPDRPALKQCHNERIETTSLLQYFASTDAKIVLQQPVDKNYAYSANSEIEQYSNITIRPKCLTPICTSYLKLTMNSVASYSLAEENFELRIKIENLAGDRFYEPKMTFDSDGDLELSYLNGIFGSVENNTCKLGYYIPDDDKIEFDAVFKPTQKFKDNIKTHPNYFNINGRVEPTKNIQDPSATYQEIVANILLEPDFSFHRNQSSTYSSPYNSNFKEPKKATKISEIGPQVLHIYNLANTNSYPIYTTNLVIYVPYKLAGDHFLYLEGPPIVSDSSIDCKHYGGKVDEYNLAQASDATNDAFADGPVTLPDNYKLDLDEHVKEKAKWLKYECVIGLLHSNQEISITLKSRFSYYHIKDLHTINKVTKFLSFAEADFGTLPLQAVQTNEKKSRIITFVDYSKEAPTKLSVLHIILIVLGSIIGSGLLASGLFMCGFFKRNKITNENGEGKNEEAGDDEEDKQEKVETDPLNEP